MTLNFADLNGVREVLLSCMDHKGRQFSYAVEKNLARVESKIHLAKKRLYGSPVFSDRPDLKLDEFLSKMRMLEMKHGQVNGKEFLRDDEGNVIVKDKEAYDKDVEFLNVTYPGCSPILEARKDAIAAMKEETFDVKFHLLHDEKQLPDELSTRERIMLRFMFAENLIPEEVLEEEEVEVPIAPESPKEEVKMELVTDVEEVKTKKSPAKKKSVKKE